ncbi:MAG TPA: hypothetical protein VFP10_06875 [Candidatus Eisenbacteria bacterium]|nr:hypothetical protein [Candidatus Eisenbacteria bacterium]
MRRANVYLIVIATVTVIAVLFVVNVGGRLSAATVDPQDQLAQDQFVTDQAQMDTAGTGNPRCKSIHGDLVEMQSTTGCKPEHPSCFLGEVDANHGLRGNTYFRGDPGSIPFPPTSLPGFRAYTGNFEYITPHGTLFMKEMGMVQPFTTTDPLSGLVNAYQRVVSGTDEFENATGYLFVAGSNRNGRVVTTLHGVICKAPR